jgi:hypothetical protein
MPAALTHTQLLAASASIPETKDSLAKLGTFCYQFGKRVGTVRKAVLFFAPPWSVSGVMTFDGQSVHKHPENSFKNAHHGNLKGHLPRKVAAPKIASGTRARA